MSQQRLNVFWGARLVGCLEMGRDDTQMSFTYAGSWLSADRALPISLSLPLSEAPYQGGTAHWFFANLLPEGTLRQLLARRLGLSVDNDFALLSAIGGECAGALAVTPTDKPPENRGYRPLSDAELEALTTPGGDQLVKLLGSGRARLSLAGAQDKVPVLVADGQLMMPQGSAPSSHILKLPSPHFRHLCANEVFCNMIAQRCGLEVPESSLITVGDNTACLVRRFDRVPASGGGLARLHQEDLCQALGMPPTRKYEAEGGPALADCFELVRAQCFDPLRDARMLLRWQIFNLLCGNADGHAKNISFLYRGRDKLSLAPSYDIVCTRIYPTLDRHMAMGIGGRRDPGHVGQTQWKALAQQLGLGARYILSLVEEMVTQVPSQAEPARDEFIKRHEYSPVLQMVIESIRRQARRTRQLL